MYKRNVSIFDCINGEVLASDVFSEHGILLARSNTKLNSFIRNKLLHFNIRSVWIYSKSPVSINTADSSDLDEFTDNYLSLTQTIEDIFKNIAIGNDTDLESLNLISSFIHREVLKQEDILHFLNKVKSYDKDTYTHCVNVAFYAALIARWLNFSEREIQDVIIAGLLHDLGKMEIPPALLNKREKLQPVELAYIKNHAWLGYSMIKDEKFLSEDIKMAVLLHHERENGSGYPLQFKGDQLNAYTKVLSIADTYDAVTSERVYRKRATPFTALKILETEGVGAYDLKVLHTAISKLSSFYIGAKVLLNTGETGEVAFVPRENPAKPVVKVTSGVIDLSRTTDIFIEKML